MMLNQSPCDALFWTKAYPRTDSLRGSAWPQRQNLGTSPAFAIRLMAGDWKPKGTQDRMVHCATAQHRVAMVNIMNRLDAYTLVA